MLLEHPGEVVLREEIRKRLWPNDTVVEVSHGINAAVLRLREALGHRHAVGLESLELANRLVRAPQRTLLGEDGLALLVTIADQADPFDEAALKLNEESAGLASALGRARGAVGAAVASAAGCAAALSCA